MIAYAQANQFHFNLWSKAVQFMIELRMEHPEWKEEWDRRRQEHRQLIGQPIICVLQNISIGKVKTVDDETFILALADQSHEATDWLRSVLPRHPGSGLYRLPTNFPFALTYERYQAREIDSQQCIELIMLPGHGEVKELEETSDRDY